MLRNYVEQTFHLNTFQSVKNACFAFNKCLPFDFRENYLKWKVPIMRTFWITQICTLKISCIQFESVGAFFGKYSTLLYDIFHSRVTQYKCQLQNLRYPQALNNVSITLVIMLFHILIKSSNLILISEPFTSINNSRNCPFQNHKKYFV